MPKQYLESQLYMNYIMKHHFTNVLLCQDHILKFHDFFVTFRHLSPNSELFGA